MGMGNELTDGNTPNAMIVQYKNCTDGDGDGDGIVHVHHEAQAR